MKKEKWIPKSSHRTLIEITLINFRGIQLMIFANAFLRVGVEVN